MRDIHAVARQKRRSTRIGRGHLEYEPWGTVHFRRFGAPAALCGLTVDHWEWFFDVRWGDRDIRWCAACHDDPRARAAFGSTLRR